MNIVKISNGIDNNVYYSLSGFAWGVASDMVMEYEDVRWLGRLRYPYLKAKWGFFCSRNHPGKVYYVADKSYNNDNNGDNGNNNLKLKICDRNHPPCEVCERVKDVEYYTNNPYFQLPLLENDSNSITIDHTNPDDDNNSNDKENININSDNNTVDPIQKKHQAMVDLIKNKLNDWKKDRRKKQHTSTEESTIKIEDVIGSNNGIDEWKEDEYNYMTLGIANTNPECKYSHSSDNSLDLLIARSGNILQTIRLGLRYLTGKETDDPLMDYIKTKKVILVSKIDKVINMDGELLPISKVSYYELGERLLSIYGEY